MALVLKQLSIAGDARWARPTGRHGAPGDSESANADRRIGTAGRDSTYARETVKNGAMCDSGLVYGRRVV